MKTGSHGLAEDVVRQWRAGQCMRLKEQSPRSVLGVADKSINHRNGGLIETQSMSDIQYQLQPLLIYWLATLKPDLRRSSQVKILWCLNVSSSTIHSFLDTL
jgi:hypothetical protein